MYKRQGSRPQETETWNGSGWTEVADQNTARYKVGISKLGTTTATIIFGGEGPSADEDTTEEYNGTSWTEVADLNTARTIHGGGTGTSTAAIAAAGSLNPPGGVSDTAETWNGTAWTKQQKWVQLEEI